MICPCPACSALGRDTHGDPPLDPVYDDGTRDAAWFDEYEPEAIPIAIEALAWIACLIAAPFVVLAIAWTSLRARWRK